MPPKNNRLSEDSHDSENQPVTKNSEEKTNDVMEQGQEVVSSLQEQLSKKDKEIGDLQKLVFNLQENLQQQQQPQGKQTKTDGVDVKSLQRQVEELSSQLAALAQQRNVMTAQGNKIMFREPTAVDLQDDSVTFTARSVLYVVGSYRDHRGLEVLPPHKLIAFTYAASDIRKDGREEEIRNYSQYTTKLKTEIEFLRNHPHYGIAFSENINSMMEESVVDIRFKSTAASQLAALPPESIYERAQEYNIPNYRQKSAEQLRQLLVEVMADEFKKAEKEQQLEATKRRVLALNSITATDE